MVAKSSNVAKSTPKASGKNVSRVRKSRITDLFKFPLTKGNYIILGIGLLVIVIGYLLLMTGITEEPAVVDGKWNNVFAVVIAPIVLVIGYCVLIPLAIMKVFKKEKGNE